MDTIPPPIGRPGEETEDSERPDSDSSTDTIIFKPSKETPNTNPRDITMVPGKNSKALNAKHLPCNSPVDINCCSITEDYYLDKYDPVSLNVTSSHDDSTDISTTYLGKTNAQQADTLQAEGSIPVFCNSHTTGRILTYQIEAKSLPSDVLFDSGISKSYMSKGFYLRNKGTHHLPKFFSTVKNIQVGSGHLVSTLFVIPIIINMNEHLFEIYTLVAEIQDNIDSHFRVKTMYEAEVELSCRTSEFRFLNRSTHMFPVKDYSIPPGEKRTIKFSSPFKQELSGYVLSKMYDDDDTICSFKIKLIKNMGTFELHNTIEKSYYFRKGRPIGIIDLRSLGYFNVSHITLSFNLAAEFDFMQLQEVCDNYNKLIDYINKKNQETYDKCSNDETMKTIPYPWLPLDDPRKQMTDKEILDRYIDLSESDMQPEEKK